MASDVLPTQESENLQWGCVFCTTGAENATSQQLRTLDGIHETFTVQQMQHRSVRGQRSEIMRVMMPGYVFFQADANLNVYKLLRNEAVRRLLIYGGGGVGVAR